MRFRHRHGLNLDAAAGCVMLAQPCLGWHYGPSIACATFISKMYTVEKAFSLKREKMKDKLFKKLKEKTERQEDTCGEDRCGYQGTERELTWLRKQGQNWARTRLERQCSSKGCGGEGDRGGKGSFRQNFQRCDQKCEECQKGGESSLVNTETLKRLAELKAAGVITEEELQAKKKEILDRI